MSELTACGDWYDATDVSGYWTRSSFTAIEAYSKCDADVSMWSLATAQMPPDLYDAYIYTGDLHYFHSSARDQFSSGQGPPWFSAMPDEVQTYFVTNMMGADEDELDWRGTSLKPYVALASTTTDGYATRVDVTTSFAVSREASYMSVLSEAFPGYLNAIIASSSTHAAATAIYNEFTSGIAPPWFSTLPYDAKSFLILDFIPNYRRDRYMTLKVLGETATTFSTSASPGSTPASVPTPTTAPGNATPFDGVYYGEDRTSNAHRTAVLVGSIVPCVFLLLVTLVVIMVQLRKKRRIQNYNATPRHVTEPENGIPTKHLDAQELPSVPLRNSDTIPADLPKVDMSPAFGDLRVLKRRSRSATDLYGWTSWPGLGHEEVPDLPPRSASAMSVRIVRPDE